MKKLLFTGLFAALIVACFAQKPYKVVFYNFENLFDTIRNPEIYDGKTVLKWVTFGIMS